MTLTDDEILDRMCREDGCPYLAEPGHTTCCDCNPPKPTKVPDDWIAKKAEHERTHGPLGDAPCRSVLMPLAPVRDHRLDDDSFTGT
jgi:hypothetical protein